MANQNSAAYDFARFEPKRREEAAQSQQKNNVIQLPQEKIDKNARPRFQPARVILMLAVLSVTLATVGSLVFGQVQLTELTDAINTPETQLAESQSVYTQLQMKSDAILNAASIEEYASQSLGMREVESSQVEYFSVSQGDEGVVLQESGPEGILDQIWNWFSQLLN